MDGQIQFSPSNSSSNISNVSYANPSSVGNTVHAAQTQLESLNLKPGTNQPTVQINNENEIQPSTNDVQGTNSDNEEDLSEEINDPNRGK